LWLALMAAREQPHKLSPQREAVEASMAKIGFIGLGNMGLPMAQNLIKSAHAVAGFDVSEYATERLATGGAARASSVSDACKDAEIVITMLPAGSRCARSISATTASWRRRRPERC